MKKFSKFSDMVAAMKTGELSPWIVRSIAGLLRSTAVELDLSEGMTEEDMDTLRADLPDDSEVILSLLVKHMEASYGDLPEGCSQIECHLGGDICVCEEEIDLKQITSIHMGFAKHHDRWPDVTDMPLTWDVCDYCCDTAESGYVLFVLCTNNSGGNSYYVPATLYEKARVHEHMALTKEQTDAYFTN
jgi:hypothetical protein